MYRECLNRANKWCWLAQRLCDEFEAGADTALSASRNA